MVIFFMARPRGVEPLTFWSVVKRSIQLSYGRIFFVVILSYDEYSIVGNYLLD